ncbi:hypothetical protein N7492_008743 [Penicillium capsulatum]|uniref:O-methyltransferase domain-containing protein n=1 Tax=Penicillium capsulatum TaxID=69766 RepID=A0A9W9HTN0_9EURO|nr:hypothetical protein N7492_008743 [Penicillium capsulatum]KAJ6106147.1 hypothetical protein N7512_009664 [Penicillium capsulatum]
MGSIGETHPDNLAIQVELDELNAAAQQYLNGSNAPIGQDARLDLSARAARLSQSIRGPGATAWGQMENMAHMGAMRALIEVGVFRTIPKGGKSMKAQEIADKTGIQKKLLVRLMRAVTPLGPFREVGEEEYAHTRFSEEWIDSPVASLFMLCADEFLEPLVRSHEFLQKDGWQDKVTTRHNPFSFTHDCEGTSMFEWMSARPKLVERFNHSMMAGDGAQLMIDMYPFAKELAGDAEDGRATLVDVGGGRGHILRQLRDLVPELPGRYILQDIPAVVGECDKSLEADGFEAMAHDFFQPQPVKGAVAYYIRRVLHDWPDEPEAKLILQNIAHAMDREKSRLLISEIIVPGTNAGMLTSWLDLAMFTLGGIQRTENNWAHLLDSAGLKIVKIWRAPGTPVGVIEARLK